MEDEREDHTHTGFHANPFSGSKNRHSRTFGAGLLYVRPGVEHNTTHPHATLEWKIESPPVIFHGDIENSSGAIISGQLFLNVKDVPFDVQGFEAKLEVMTTHKRPFQTHCANCANSTTELKKWSFLVEPTTLKKGKCQPSNA